MYGATYKQASDIGHRASGIGHQISGIGHQISGIGNNIKSYRDLDAWKHAKALVKEIYRFTEPFPKAEAYGLAGQLRRAAVSAPSNIAEGYGRGSLRDYVRFLKTARGSLYEIETQLLLAIDIGYAENNDIRPAMDSLEHCKRLLQGLIRSLEKNLGD